MTAAAGVPPAGAARIVTARAASPRSESSLRMTRVRAGLSSLEAADAHAGGAWRAVRAS